MRVIQGVPVRQIKNRFSIGFAVVAVCIASIGFVNYQNLEHVRADWIDYTDYAQRKGLLVSDLNDAVGYGGAIHQFKNYVLRKDAQRPAKVSAGFEKAQQILREYRKLPIDESEAIAIDDISAVFSEYAAALPIITKMIAEGATSNEIDKSVKISDAPAVDGLHLLENTIREHLELDAADMEIYLTSVESMTFWGSIVNTALLCVLFVALMGTFRAIIGRIGGEPNDIMAIAQRIADGDLDENLDAETRPTGIYGAIVSMQANLRIRTQREQEAAAINERLKQALDNASSNVMVADMNNDIVFINKTGEKLFASKEMEIRSTLPKFNASEVVGSNIDLFHRTPSEQRSQGSEFPSDHRKLIKLGSSTFSLSVNPVLTDDGDRVGTVVEWFDRTEELKQEVEVQALVVAATRGDLSKRIDASDRTGFFGNLMMSMNELMDVNDRAVSEVQSVFAALAVGDLTARVKGEYQGVYHQLKENANVTVDQLTEIITKVKNNAMVIAAASTELIATNKSLNATAEDGAKQAEIASCAASNVMSNVDAVASASSDLESSVSEITRNVSEAVGVASEAVTLAQSTNTQVRKLTTSSSDIGNVIKVINSIAEQTNLLALNATIEAARAGDAGKGFAVVANEVKELAKGTASATDEIAQKVKAIQGDSGTAVTAIGEIGSIIETISQYQNTIADAVNHQNIATQRINENASEAARGNLEITRTSERVSEGTVSTVSGVSQVQASAVELSRMAVELSNLVEDFKVEA